VMIGNAEYHCSCVQYVSRDNNTLIVGVVVAVVVVLLTVVITVVSVVVLHRRQQSKKMVEYEGSEDSNTVSINENHGADQQYSTHLPDY